LSFGDQKYFDAAKRTAEWQLLNPSYPYQYPAEAFMYYSNVNHLARSLWNLTEVYKITVDQRYLNRAIQLAEEIIAWQDYQDNRDPWGETKNPDGTWDGGWYWYNYSPTPIPPTCEPNGGIAIRSGFSAEKKMDYHTATVYGLIKLLEATQQQVLPGTTTIRNGISFEAFRNNLTSSIKKAMNYMIRYQEQNNSTNTFRGLFKSYKNDKMYGWDATFDWTNTVSAPHGLSTIIDAYLALLKANSLTAQDQARLVSLINGVSENMVNKYSGGWGYDEWRTEGMMINWSRFMYYISLPTITSTLSLVNPSFEDKDIKWELWSWDGTGVGISSTQKRTGNNSVHLIDINGNASKWASILVSATPNITYKAEAYARIVNNYQAIYLHYYDASFNLVDFAWTPIYSNSNFQYVSVQKQAPSNATYVRITLYADWYGISEGYWDDVSLTTVMQKQSAVTQIPISFSLQNYPNPFNPTTKISFSLPQKDHVQLKVFDSIGREVASLANGIFEIGKHEIEFNAVNLPSGTYIYSLRTKNKIITKKMLLVK
jgi:hypothetical protein